MRAHSAVLMLGCLLAVMSAAAQEIHLGDASPAPGTAAVKKQHVELLDDAVSVNAGKPQDVELRFQVDPGLHINSHKPSDELLLPTQLELNSTPQLRVLNEEYPAGKPFHLNIGAGETLSVYQGEFRVHVRLVAARGAETLTGTLRYQACDTASCYPPRALPVKIAVTAR